MSVSGPGHWMDQMFQRKLNQFEMHPEDHLWEGIARKLDEEKRRAPWFGNWWTVLIASLIVVLVTGTGAYLYYKKQQKAQQVKPEINKDLPQQFPQHNNQDKGTATLPESNTGGNVYLVSNPPARQSVSAEWRTAGEETPVLKTSRVYNRSINPESKLSSKSFVVLDREADRIIQDGSSDANQLIVSSDQSFLNPLADRSSTEETFPLLWQDRFLNTSKQDLTAPAIVDGCNVYRNEKTRYFVDVYYAPELANRSLKGNDAISNTYAQERAQSEKPIMSYSAGVRGSMVFANGLSLRAGLSYSNNTERFDFVKERQTITREIKDKDGNVIRTEIEELVILDKMYNHYKYFDLPILIGYERDLKDFILSLNSGLAFNLSADQSGKIYKPDIKTVYELERSGEANESIFRNNAGVSFIASVGLNYKYNERMMLLLEPSARYYLRSLSDASNPVSQKYLFLGMNIGVRYRIQ